MSIPTHAEVQQFAAELAAQLAIFDPTCQSSLSNEEATQQEEWYNQAVNAFSQGLPIPCQKHLSQDCTICDPGSSTMGDADWAAYLTDEELAQFGSFIPIRQTDGYTLRDLEVDSVALESEKEGFGSEEP